MFPCYLKKASDNISSARYFHRFVIDKRLFYNVVARRVNMYANSPINIIYVYIRLLPGI